MLPRLGLPAPATNEDDPAGTQAYFDLIDLVPAVLPAWVVGDRRVEPRSRAPFRATVDFENPLIGLVVGRFGEGRPQIFTVDAVARPEGLHAGRTRPEGARDPLIAPSLVYPTLYVIYELP